MALKKLTLRPGINKEGTSYSNEDGFYNSDKIRFRSGYAEKLGGWQNIGSYTYVGVARSLWSWVSLTSETLTGVGTSQKFYVENGTKYYDITPLGSVGTVDSPGYFTTSSGSPVVTVTDNSHGVTVGTYVTFTKAYTTLSQDISVTDTTIPVVSVTGFLSGSTNYAQIGNETISYTGYNTAPPALTGVQRGVLATIPTSHIAGEMVVSLQAIMVGGINVQGSYPIATITSNTYTFIASASATSPATGGSGTYAIYDLNASKGALTRAYGWGAGGWGVVPWGSDQAATSATPIRLWSQTNYDQDLMFAPRNGSIYWWTKNTQSYPRAITLNSYANTQIKTPVSTTATWSAGGSTLTVNDASGINFGAIVTFNPITTTLGSPGISNSSTTAAIPVASTASFPSSGTVQIDQEQISYTGTTTTPPYTLTGITRGVNGTSPSAAAHSTGATVSLVVLQSGTVAYVDPGYSTTTGWQQGTSVPLITKQGSPVSFVSSGISQGVNFSYSGNHIPYKTLYITTSSQNAFTIAFGASSYNPRMLETPAVVVGGTGAAFNTTLVLTSITSGSLYPGMEISGTDSSGNIIPAGTTLVSTTEASLGMIWVVSQPIKVNAGTTITAIAPFDPLMVRWSDQDKPWEWVPEVTNQSGEQRLSNGSIIITAVNTRQEILIWTDTAIYSMQYLGPPYVYGINLLMDNLSIASPNAAITVNNVTYWMGVDRFYSYSGRVETLPCTLRQFIYSNINKDQLGLITCGSNEGFNEIWWFYPSAGSTSNDRYVIFNHLENVWYYGTIYRSTWLDTQLKQYPLGAFSTESTSLYLGIDASQTSIQLDDTSSLPSSGVVTIGNEQISYASINYSTNTLNDCVRGFNSTLAVSHTAYATVQYTTPNQIMFHEIGWDDVSGNSPAPIYSYIESSDFDIDDGLNFSYVWRIIPDLTFSGSTTSSPKCYLTVKTRQNSGSAYNIDPSDPVNDPYDAQAVYRTSTSPVEQYTGQVYVRVRGRQMAFRMESTDLGVFWQMGMMRIDVRQDGRR